MASYLPSPRDNLVAKVASYAVEDAAAKTLSSATRLMIRQIWIYTALIVIIVGGLVAVLAQDWRLFVPIGGLSIVVGVVGTVMALLQERPSSADMFGDILSGKIKFDSKRRPY